MKSFYLISSKLDPELLKSQIRLSRPSKVFLCPLEYGCEETVAQTQVLLAELNISHETIPFLKIFNTNAFAHKERFLNFINGVGESQIQGNHSFKEYFRIPGTTDSGWWLSLIYEKNPYKTQAYTLFTKTLSILELVKAKGCEEIWISSDFEGLRNIFQGSVLKNVKCIFLQKRIVKNVIVHLSFFLWIKEQIRALKAFLSLLVRVLFLKRKGNSKTKYELLKKSRYILVTMFPLLDRDALKQGRFVNRAYGALQKAIDDEPESKKNWIAMHTHIEGMSWKQAVELSQEVKNSGENIIFYEEFISFKEVLKILSTYVRFSLKTFLISGKVSGHFRYRFEENDLQFWSVFKKDFISSFSGKELCVELGYYFAFQKLGQNVSDSGMMLYFAEMHAWESALNMAVRCESQIIRVGLQHTIVPLLLINYFHTSDELKSQNMLSAWPAPDFLGCSGEVTRDIFMKSHWPSSKVFTLGAFRFQNLFKQKPAVKKKRQVVVALSISPLENREILYLLNDVFLDNALNCKVLIKPHPCDDIQQSLKALPFTLSPDVFEISHVPLSESVPESLAMIVKESSSMFEALKTEVPVIIPQLYSIIDLCPLSGISPCVEYVYNAKELKDIMVKIITGTFHFPTKNVNEILNRYLSLEKDERNYLKNCLKAVKPLHSYKSNLEQPEKIGS